MSQFAKPVPAPPAKKNVPSAGAARPRAQHAGPPPGAIWQAIQRRAGGREAPASGASLPAGLPAPLKAGVETLSGIAMDDVRVHRNSPEPAKLSALAYAQGSDIHLGPGQERHLPHEAWHVVQQKQGRVAPTAQMKGADVNDDSRLEQEADAMGRAALDAGDAGAAAPTRLERRLAPAQPVQRKKIVHRDGSTLDKKEQAALDGIAGTLDASVDSATQLIFANPTLSGYKGNVGKGYVDAWATTFAAMISSKSIPEFFYARYGYAVETLASALMPRSVDGHKIETQYATGATRPDFVVWNAKEEDVAWLDITSASSTGHIFAKQHSGWRSRPYVAEIVYKPPTVSDFASSSTLSEEQKKAFATISTQAAEQELDYQTGHAALGPRLERALNAATKNKQITKTDAKAAVWKEMQAIDSKFTAEAAGQVFRCIESITIAGSTASGKVWADWAFAGRGYKTGRAYLAFYGGNIRRPPSNTNSNSSASASASAPQSVSSAPATTSAPAPLTTSVPVTTTTSTSSTAKPDVDMTGS